MAVLGFPVSVSLSQMGGFLALVGWGLMGVGRRQGSEGIPEMPFHMSPVFYPILGLYAVLLVSLLFNGIQSDRAGAFILRGLRTEWKDLFLMPAALWVYSFTRDPRGQRDFLRWMELSIWIMLVGGFLAIFTEFRLSNIPYHLLHGWETTAKARFQHVVTTLPPLPVLGRVTLFMPVGFMNTHLTYAAQLSFVFPVLLYRVFDPFVQNEKPWPGVSYLKPLGMLLLATIILILNNGRSAIAGLLLALAVSLYVSVRLRWGWKTLRLLVPLLLLVLLALGVYGVSSKIRNRVDQVVAPLVGEKKKHTDYQRAFLWQSVNAIVNENPYLGVGPGAFEEQVQKRTLEYSRHSPPLWYGYSVIQRGHAHNDIWHYLAIGGPGVAGLYLVFFGLLLYTLTGKGNDSPLHSWKWGLLTILGGGLLQCYFQDDEVLLPFWLLVGFALRISEKETSGGESAGKSA